ncbi:tRNA splicing endonuclease subunit sen2 [Sorochytrium milnesiophthora]
MVTRNKGRPRLAAAAAATAGGSGGSKGKRGGRRQTRAEAVLPFPVVVVVEERKLHQLCAFLVSLLPTWLSTIILGVTARLSLPLATPVHEQRLTVEYATETGVFAVRDHRAQQLLWKHSAFGKGILSRANPTWRARQTSREGHLEDLTKRRRLQRSATTDAEYPAHTKQHVDAVPVEYLRLAPSEAFYLLHYAHSVRILTSKQDELDGHQLWNLMRRRSGSAAVPWWSTHNSFIVDYVAYHYFRTKRWVVKSGLKFGTNYVLYKQGPAATHAEYAVVVKPVGRDAHSSGDMDGQWLLTMNRALGQAKKKLLICHVMVPDDLDEDALQQPDVILRYSVQSMCITRWRPEANRA